MKLIQRIGYYLGGFSIGLIILAFFFNGKKTSCSYGPEARVLKNINLKEIVYSSQIQSDILNKRIDSITISTVLKKGNISFSKSKTRQKPCAIYSIEGNSNNKKVVLTVENCSLIATILNYKIR